MTATDILRLVSTMLILGLGSLTGNVFQWYGDWLDSAEAVQAERRGAR